MRKIICLLVGLISFVSWSQELNCTVKINAQQAGLTNNQVFNTLEKSLNDFINRTSWTGQELNQGEKIPCSMFITVTSYSNNIFTASIQVQSGRQVYGSGYVSPMLNYNDRDFNFDYVEFQNLVYNPGTFDSNLVAVVAFYCNVILGLDGDSMGKNGGQKYFDLAQDIASAAQSSNYKGWKQSDGNNNRYFLINDIRSNTFQPFRQALYDYHRNGLDLMSQDAKAGKDGVIAGIDTLSEIHSVRPNAFLTRVFFDAKVDELVSIFSGGPTVNTAQVIDKLNRLSPLNASKWNGIKM